MELLVLSPHLDDAVLSIGGLCARTVRAGGRVLVVTFCTEAAPRRDLPRALLPFADLERRRAEDEAALGRIGAEPRWLGFVERALRPPRIGLSGLFRLPARADALDELSAMRAAVRELLAERPGAEVLCPLGVGEQRDHVAVFLAGLAERIAGCDRICFYEDFYAAFPAARARHFVTRRDATRRGDPGLTAPLPGALGRHFERVVGPPLDGLLPDGALALDWRFEPAALKDEDAALKFEALACYASQLEVLGGRAGLEQVLARMHAHMGQAEPVWRAEGSRC